MISWLPPRGKNAPPKSWTPFILICLPQVFFGALLLTGSVPIAVCGCSACVAVIMFHLAAKRWRRDRHLQAAAARSGRHAGVKPERAWMTRDELDSFALIVAMSYTEQEILRLNRRGAVLRANRPSGRRP